MDEQHDLEKRLNLLTIDFANQENCIYDIEKRSKSDREYITISVGKPIEDWGMKELFRHRVMIARDTGNMINQSTLYVASGMDSDASIARNLYTRYIRHMNSNGIGLVNGFAETWASNPRRYLIE